MGDEGVEGIVDGVVDEEVLDDVDEIEYAELPDVDLEDGVDAAVAGFEDVEENENVEDPYVDIGRRGAEDTKRFFDGSRTGVEGTIEGDGGVGASGSSDETDCVSSIK